MFILVFVCGGCVCRYVAGKDGFKRLQTVRLDDENLYTPEINTFTASAHNKSDSSDQESDLSESQDSQNEDDHCYDYDQARDNDTNQTFDVFHDDEPSSLSTAAANLLASDELLSSTSSSGKLEWILQNYVGTPNSKKYFGDSSLSGNVPADFTTVGGGSINASASLEHPGSFSSASVATSLSGFTNLAPFSVGNSGLSGVGLNESSLSSESSAFPNSSGSTCNCLPTDTTSLSSAIELLPDLM